MTKVSYQYTAGFLDGEGTIGISVNKSTAGYPVPGLRVAFANFDDNILRLIQKRWGGSLSEGKTGVWSLHINGNDAYELLKDIAKYTYIKRDACEKAIVYQEIDFVSPDENPQQYIDKLEAALAVMQATRDGYKAKRSSVMMDRLKRAIEFTEARLAGETNTEFVY